MRNSEPSDSTDEVLVIRCQLGTRDAWEALVRRWHPRLSRFVRRMLCDQQAVDDVMQDIWLRVVRSLIRVENPDRFSAWLFGLARNAVLDRLREKYRQQVEEELGDVPDWDESEQQVAVNEDVENALAGLHPAEREAVVLFYLEGLPVKEVAEICAVPPGTIKSRLYRARHLMRETLDS